MDVCTDRALAFIEKNKSNPFFCYVPFTTPHSPWAAPEQNWLHFKDKPMTLRATLPDKEALEETRCALAMLENQDWNVGRVLAKLKEHKLEDNTIIVYFSDNGPNTMRWTGGMKGKKGNTDEGGVRSVCYVRWLGKLPAAHTVLPVSGAIDLLPTITALAGIRSVGDKPLDGRDLSPLLLNRKWRGLNACSSPLGAATSACAPRRTASTIPASFMTWSPIPARRCRSTTGILLWPPDSVRP